MSWTLRFCALLLTGTATATAQVTSTTNPHGPAVGACGDCHGPAGWRPARISRAFVHAPGRFALDGAHARTACTSCHTSLEFTKTSKTCAQCHRDVHNGELGVTCGQCHTTRSFVDEQNLKRMHELTRFPLRGAHQAIDCAACHPPAQPGQSQYRRRPTACIGCHSAAYRGVREPDHQAAGFPQDCSQCHTSTTWRGGLFDHAATKFALTGAHVAVSCEGCHANGVFRGRTTTCGGCHQDDYTWSKSPPHAASGFPTDCAMCHTSKAWQGASFNHDITVFPLTGAHRATLCSSCHGDGTFKGKATACVACHQADYSGTAAPAHAAAGFGTTCQQCHSTTAWRGSAFDHSVTAFPLAGAHKAAACTACHGDGVYKGKATACASCHMAQYTAARTPPHAGFPTTCQSCHGVSAWTGGAFDHSLTLFALTGAHRTVACMSCHADNVYKGKNTACISCHQPAYNSASRPPHATLAFPTTCTNCHTTVAWPGAVYDHATTRFALNGAHLAVSCDGCHGDGVYRGKPVLCAACHQARFDAAVAPNHRASGFPNTCEVCHGTTTWTPATFNHSATRFALTGAHAAQPCASCHGDGVYRGKTTLCSGCHLPQYNATTNPAHKAANFPATCESCHTTARWTGATFNHDGTYFPIYSGKHKGRWSSCADCHTVSTNYKSFSCFSCHRQTETDKEHRGRTGYRYESALCYQCHPQGRS